jgi:hypothetical protein
LAKFDELNNNLMDVLIKLISSQNLCKLLTYTTSDPLSGADITDTSTLLFDKIYPIPKIPDVLDAEGSFVTIVFDEMRLSNNIGFKDSVLCFYVFCHINLWRTDGALRPYSIMHEIDILFNNQRAIGLGKLQFLRSKAYPVNAKYFAYKLDYSVVDFNW